MIADELLKEKNEAHELAQHCRNALDKFLNNGDILNARYAFELMIQNEILIADIDDQLRIFIEQN